jgi:hypothetical protein
MNGLFKDIKNDKLTFRGFTATFIFILVPIPFIIFLYRNLPPFLPIFNQLPWGPERLSSTWGIFIPLIISFIIFIFNLILSSFLYKKSPLVSRMLSIVSFLIALLTLLFIFRTIQIVL